MTNYRKIKSMNLDKTAEFLVHNFPNDDSNNGNFEEHFNRMKNKLKSKPIYTDKPQHTGIPTFYRKLKSLTLDEMTKFLKYFININCKTMCPCADENGECTLARDSDDSKCIEALKNWLKAESEED